MTRSPLTLYLAAPRGFCAGVDRAIKIVEMALEKWGAPVYVRHEIVHNRYVVDALRAKGAVFVDELDAAPVDRPIIFSAHGVPKAIPEEARRRGMIHVDATCPLVTKVHNEAARHAENGLQMVMIGHAGHPETEGTMGQLPPGEVLLVETTADIARLEVRNPDRLAYITQTTLSVDDTAEIVAALRARFPAIIGPHKEDICYATTNRQHAVKAMASAIDALLVIGAPNSSNSRRLVEVGARAGCSYAQLVQRAADIDWRAIEGVRAVGLTAGASAPEVLVDEVINAFRDRYDLTVELVETAVERVEFKVPRVCGSRHDGRPAAGILPDRVLMADVFAYTDGACSGNPGPGGWGAVLVAREGDQVLRERELSGGAADTTNNRMELLAAISALESLTRPTAITVVTDSAYLKNGVETWIDGWKRNGWRTAARAPVKNEDLWRRLDEARARHTVVWAWTKGHAGHPENERADALAREAMKPFRKDTRQLGRS